MSITKPKLSKPTDAVVGFIDKAPDAAAATPVLVAGEGKGADRKERISLTVAPSLLKQIDLLATKMGQSRAGLINMAMFRLIEAERGE
jgi:hypothetical protein